MRSIVSRPYIYLLSISNLFLLTGDCLYCFTTAPSVYKRCTMKNYTTESVRIEGLVGVFPKEIQRFILHLKKAAQDLKTGKNSFPSFWKNRNTMLLHGESGNGQHTIARTIAEQTNSALFEYSFSEESGIRESKESYQARDEIQELFAKAKQHVIKHKQTVVIYIDNIHIVGEDFWGNPKLPMGALWIELDGIVDNQNIVVITSSKTCRFISEPFLDRLGGAIMKIHKPNQEMRLDLIKFFWKKFLNDVPCDQVILNSLTDLSKGLCIREIEEVFKEASQSISLEKSSTMNIQFLQDQINTIQNRNTRILLKDLCIKIKNYGPKTLQALILICVVCYGTKIIKKWHDKPAEISTDSNDLV